MIADRFVDIQAHLREIGQIFIQHFRMLTAIDSLNVGVE